jgi:AraC family transcriptional regulator
MHAVIEQEMHLPTISVQLATVEWQALEDSSHSSDRYCICQRLSYGHAPLRVENINAREAFMYERSVAFLPPNCSVRIYPLDRPFKILNCTFPKEHFETITEISELDWEEHTGALVSIRDRRMEVLMQEIHSELTQPGYASEVLIEAVGKLILVEMARYARQLGTSSNRNSAGQALAPWQLRRIQERIDAALDRGYPTLEELASLCGISQSHLMRTFKLSTGWPVHKFITSQRLDAAKRLLAADQLSTKEIAAKLGFRTPAYFATTFHRLTGQTPSKYRHFARAAQRTTQGSAQS